MLKKFVSSLLVILLLVGCSSSNKEETVEPENTEQEASVADLAKEIVDKLGMAESLTEFPSNRMKGMLFQMDEEAITDGALYIDSNKKADTIGVFTTNNPDKCLSYIQDYIQSLTDAANNYSPDELFKIDKAIVETNDARDMVVFIICEDVETAKAEANRVLGK